MNIQIQLMALWWLTLDGFRTCADAVFRAVYLFSLHNNVLETFIICVEAMLQQLTEGHRAVGHGAQYGFKTVENLLISVLFK